MKTYTLEETIDQYSCTVLKAIPEVEYEPVLKKHSISIEDVRLFHFIILNLIDNEHMHILEYDNKLIRREMLKHGICYNRSVDEMLKISDELYNLELEF